MIVWTIQVKCLKMRKPVSFIKNIRKIRRNNTIHRQNLQGIKFLLLEFKIQKTQNIKNNLFTSVKLIPNRKKTIAL